MDFFFPIITKNYLHRTFASKLSCLGVKAITGKPYHPQTQGKNERFHQTLFRFLDKQPLAETIAQLQEQVDQFDIVYNTQRPHQGLPGRLTPQQAWDATPVAAAPRPAPTPAEPVVPLPATMPTHPASTPALAHRVPRGPLPEHGERQVTILGNGTASLRGVSFLISHPLAGHVVHAVWDPDGVVLAKHPWPPTGTTYVSTHAPTNPPRNRGGRPRKNPAPPTQASPMS